MKAQTVSSYAASLMQRQLVSSTKNSLIQAQQEATTGKVFDYGLSLGAKAGSAVGLQQEFGRLGVQLDSNKLLQQRMKTSQASMTAISEQLSNVLATLPTATSASGSAGILEQSAKNAMKTISGLLNTSFNGEYLFGGLNVDKQPIKDNVPTMAAHTEFEAAFENFFGFGTKDERVSDISKTQITNFLENNFQQMFSGESWSNNWSSATDNSRQSQISTNELVQTSVSGNAVAFRSTFAALMMVSELSSIGLNDQAFGGLVEVASGAITAATTFMTGERAKLGLAEEKVKEANDRIEIMKTTLNRAISDQIGVDPYEAATRVNLYVTQLESSYALTTRLQNLTLMNYLR